MSRRGSTARLRSIGAERCLRCDTTEDLTVDHVIPTSRGGPDSPANWQPLCQRCNVWKQDRVLDYRGLPAAPPWPLSSAAAKRLQRRWWADEVARDAGRELWLAFLQEQGSERIVYTSMAAEAEAERLTMLTPAVNSQLPPSPAEPREEKP